MTTTNRLTAADYRRIDERLTERIGDIQQRQPAYRPHAHEWKRLAYHAIGCSEFDLRGSELAALAAQVDAICLFMARRGAERYLRECLAAARTADSNTGHASDDLAMALWEVYEAAQAAAAELGVHLCEWVDDYDDYDGAHATAECSATATTERTAQNAPYTNGPTTVHLCDMHADRWDTEQELA